MLKIYTRRHIDGMLFLLAEHIDNYVEAQVAAAEYRCEGLLCRVQVVDDERLYYIWTGPKRKRMPRLLPDETVSRGSTKHLKLIKRAS